MIPLQNIHPQDPSWFPSPLTQDNPVKIITARIYEAGTEQIFQDVFAYVYQDEEGDWEGEGGDGGSWRRILYTQVEIPMPLYVTPDDLKQDIENALWDNNIHEQGFEVKYTLAPKDSI